MIGDTIRRFRQERELTVRQLAELAGVSGSYISLLETGGEDPSVSILRKLSQALHRPISAFFMEDFPAPVITRAGERQMISSPSGLSWERLTPELPEEEPRMLLLRILLKAEAAVSCDSFPEQTCIFLQTGALEINLPAEHYRLESGDSLYLSAGTCFTIRSLWDAPSQMIVSLSGEQIPVFRAERSPS